MLLDKYLSYDNKVIIAVIFSGTWIYFRTSDCYKLIPRAHIFPIIFVMIWTYLNSYEPLFLPLGLMILVLYSQNYPKFFFKEKTNGEK
jgi:predicted tellurium resistance membrane protein TerC